MESLAVHATTPPQERLAPSFPPSRASSPAPAAHEGTEQNANNDNVKEPGQSKIAEVPVSPPRSNPSPPLQSPPASPLADLAPLPSSFDPDAPPPPLPDMPIDDELATRPKEAESEMETEPPAEPLDADLAELAPVTDSLAEPLDEMQVDVDPGQLQNTDEQLLASIKDIQDIQEYGGDERGDDMAQSQREDSPLTPLSPLPDLPTDLPDLPDEGSPLPPDSELSTATAARARKARLRELSAPGGDNELSAEGKKQKAGPQIGPDGKRLKKPAPKRKGAEVGRDSAKLLERTQPRPKAMTDNRLKEVVKGRTSELQVQPCLRPRYEEWGKCVQCIAKVGGDSCRFRNYRQFPLDPETSKIIGKGVFPSTELQGKMTALPQEFNTELTREHIAKTEQTVAPMLLNLITAEMRHVITNNAIRRPVDAAQHRAVCDFCASTIFAGFWFCKKCGRDYCIYCERYVSETTTNLLDSPWPIPDRSRTRLQKCSRGDDSELPLPKKRFANRRHFQHSRGDLVAASRLSADELRSNWSALVNFVLEPSDDVDIEERIRYLGIREDETELVEMVREWFESQKGKGKKTRTLPYQRPVSDDQVKAMYDASKDLPRVADPAELDSHPFMFIDGDKMDDDMFDQLWARGEPLVVDNVAHRFRLDWSPDAFIRRFGPERCLVLDCQTEKVSEMSIGQFFTLLKDPTRTQVYVPPPPPRVNPPPRLNTRPERKRARVVSETESGSGERGRSASKTPVPPAGGAEKEKENEKEGANGTVNGKELATNGHVEGTEEQVGGETTQEKPVEAANDAAIHSPASEEVPVKKITTGTLKLKDWPATNDFSEAYPDLYEDFCRALPAPNYTMRNGVMNLYAHFPKGATRPDIGPKMYNAFEGQEGPGGQGSTRLHMDVADAVNIMLYASPREDGTPGCAVWDLFRAEDANAIRDFLSTKFAHKAAMFTDPIHSQMFYLDSGLRKELYESKGVKSFRVYQYPGQAVFIPAGCAHQVCNLADCTKIALDFVSPHNVKRCQQLTQDFRKENFNIAWKDDVLQLYNVMWYAWTNVRETRDRLTKEAAKVEQVRAARSAHLASLANGGENETLALAMYRTQTSSVRDDPVRSPRTDSDSTMPLASPEKDQGTERGKEVAQAEQGNDGDDSRTDDECPIAPPASLVSKLMEAAVSRELQPIAIDVDAKPHITPPPESPQTPEKRERSTSHPVRYRDMVERGHLPLDLAVDVMRSQMGQAMDVDVVE